MKELCVAISKSRTERRVHDRRKIVCPITICRQDGTVLAKTHTVNISDSGAFLAVPLDALPPLDAKLRLSLAVPRSTANTYMLEQFECEGQAVRHQPLLDNDQAGIGVRFSRPIDFMLDV